MNTKTLKVNTYGCLTSDNEFGSYGIYCYIVTKDNKRLTLKFWGHDFQLFRYYKKNGERLKKAVKAEYIINLMSVQVSEHHAEAWSNKPNFEKNGYDGGSGRHDIWEEVRAEKMQFTKTNVLKVINKHSKDIYKNIEIVEEAEKPVEWATLEKLEYIQALNEEQEKIISRASKMANTCLKRSICPTNFIKNEEIENGATEQEKEKALEIAKKGGNREKNIANAQYIAIYKVFDIKYNLIKIFNLAQSTSILIDVDRKTIVG